jgi:hypothetical protein
VYGGEGTLALEFVHPSNHPKISSMTDKSGRFGCTNSDGVVVVVSYYIQGRNH